MNELSDFLSEFEESGGSEVRMMRLKCDGDGRLCWQADRRTGSHAWQGILSRAFRCKI